MSSRKLLNVFQYWGQGFNAMPLFLKIIYKHNLEFCKKNNINLILIDDFNVNNYIIPHLRFKTLAYHFKSDIIRYYILHKYGGFWFDTDVIIIKDLNNLYISIRGYECMLDVEYGTNIGCCSLFIKKQSAVSKFCIECINNILDENKNMVWGEIGPNVTELLYKKHQSVILLNNYKTVKNGCNFICWKENPGINKRNWYLKSENLAKSKADFLKNNINCCYLITWTIYRINDMGHKLNNMVFNDKRSVFSYFVNCERGKIIVKNFSDSEWNGEYLEGEVKYKDNETISYVKDNKHHIYQHKGLWRLGENGVKSYKQLGNEIGNEIDYSNDDINICFCSDENLISYIPIVINSIQSKNSKNQINIHYIHSNISKNKLDIFKNYVSNFTNLELYLYHKTWDFKYKGLGHITKSTMLRLYIPELLNNITKVIYLDIDIVVNLNLNELYYFACGETGIAIKNSIVKPDGWIGIRGQKNGNCGIIVMNLETLRKNNFTQKCLEIHSRNKKKHDQWIINKYTNSKHKVLPARFNIFLNQDDDLIESETDFILHYAGSKKPYFQNTGKYQYLWNENYFEQNKEFISVINVLPPINITIIDELYYNMYNIETSDIDIRKRKKEKILTNYYNKNKDQFKNEVLIIDYSTEGTQFTENINFMIDILTKLSNKRIILLSSNYLSISNNIKYYNYSWKKALTFCKSINYNKTRKNNFLLLSGSINNSFRKHKLIILLYLFKEKILDKGIYSLTDIKNCNSSLQDYYISNKFSNLRDIEKKYFRQLKDISPKIIDIDPSDKKLNNTDTFSTKMIEIIKDTKFHIIIETEYTDSSNILCRYTEKITKILAIGSPFIVFGCHKVLELLHKDGFKTFSPFINEEYDLIDDLELRTQAIIKEINRLCGLSQLEWIKIHEKMIDIQKHNITTLNRLVNSKDFIYKDIYTSDNKLNNIQNQISNCSHENHYPLLHQYIKSKYIPLNILSFGSSNGSEVNDLKKTFPNSIIHGLEINKDLVAKCNSNNMKKNIMFYDNIGNLNFNTYDLITCISVLCRWPDSSEYTFELFEKTIQQIDNLLNDNGIFILINSKFLFTETKFFKNYAVENVLPELIFNPGKGIGRGHDWVPKYHKDGTKCITQPPFIFRKKSYIKKHINLGVLIYNNSYHRGASSNIGDYIQSLAAINIYRKIIQDFNNTKYEIKEFLDLLIENELPNFNIVFIKRDNMYEIEQYNGLSNIITIMNGWWMHPYNENMDISFNIPLNITPIFVSFHLANDKLLQNQYIDELKKYQPIGCRDLKTTDKLKNKGIDAYFTGCLTSTIDFFKWNKQNDTIFNTDTKVKEGVYFSHMSPKWKNIDYKKGLIEALDILKNYSKCELVNTSRLHCYLPCLAMGVPVNFISPDGDSNIKTWGSKDRFDGLRELQDNSEKLIEVKSKLEKKTNFEVRKQIFKNIFNIGKAILSNIIIGYDEKTLHKTQTYYYILAGFVKYFNISNVVEIGTHKGGSGLAIINGNDNLQLVTIDIKEYDMAVERLYKYSNCKRLIGDSLSTKIQHKVKEYLKNKTGKTLLFIDCLKDGKWIEKNIEFYKFVNPDYIIIDDITIDETMKKWWNDFSSRYNCFNFVDYLGRGFRNISKLNCGFGLVCNYEKVNNKVPQTNYAVMWASTVNIGDDIQTLAAINFLKKKGITEYTFIDREKLSDYDGEPVTLIMNGWYMHNISKFPPSDKITPVFISVHINNDSLISNNINYFKKYQPFGCRDKSTVDLFKKHGINAYFTGCLTLLFDDVKEKSGGKYLVDVNTKCNYIPNIELDTSKYNDFQIIEHDINFSYFENSKKYLLCIISYEKNRHIKEWIKKYWLNDLINNTNNIDYLFVYGHNNQIKDYEFKGDELHLKCDDGYFKLNEKMYYLWNYLAKKHSKKYDFYIKCDDDNYINNFKFCKLLMDTQELNSFGIYNNNKTSSYWNKIPTGEWHGPFWEGAVYWFNQEVINFYCDNITQIDMEKNRCEDKLFSDTIRNCTKIKPYEGDISFIGYPSYENFSCIGHGSPPSKVNLFCYNNSSIISNLKQENHFKFFHDCFMNDHANGGGELFKLIKINDRIKMANNLLNKYRNAEMVLTTRLHCILPCRAFNTNAIFIHKKYDNDPRFSGLKNIINGGKTNHSKINGNRYEIEKIRNNFLLLKI